MPRKSFTFPVTSLAGSGVSNIIALTRAHQVEPRYYPKLSLTYAVAGIFELFNAWERVLWRKRIASHRMKEPPLFIIGFWRSGTTLLHNLLCQDSHAAYTTTMQTVFPHITLTQGWWVKAAANLLLPPKRPFDNVQMNMGFPQEEEFGLTNIQPFSLYNFFLFPADFDRIADEELFTENFPEEQLEAWKAHYRGMVSKALLNTGGTRYVSKNPCNMVRMKLLKEMYPGAKFIFIFRDPYKAVESLYRFVLSIFPGVQLQQVPPDFGREKIIRLYVRIMRYYLKTKSAIPASDLVEIRMEDFIQDTTFHLRDLYEKLRLDSYEESVPAFQKYLVHNSEVSREPYEIPDETYRLMNELAPDIIQALGYETRTVTKEPVPQAPKSATLKEAVG
jgi:hypothetical protein